MQPYYIANPARLSGRKIIARKWRKYEVDPEYMSGCQCSDCVAAAINSAKTGDYEFILYVYGKYHAIKAGCRRRTIQEYRESMADWPDGYENKRRATLAILDAFEKRLRAYRKEERAKARKPAPAKKAPAKKARKAKGKK